MRAPVPALLLAALCVAAPALAQPRECPVAGTRIHWIADYCMAKLETDDEIAASDCINAQAARKFRSDCAAKLYYKRAMCRSAIALQYRPGDVKSCVADREFKGSTVRNGGVGGA